MVFIKSWEAPAHKKGQDGKPMIRVTSLSRMGSSSAKSARCMEERTAAVQPSQDRVLDTPTGRLNRRWI